MSNNIKFGEDKNSNFIKFGPGGLGPVNEAVENLKKFHEIGLRACEIEFTYGIYITKEKDIKEIREISEKLGIRLSIHAPYWVNLNSKEKIKIEQSKQRILKCCEIGEKLGSYRVVFHPGFYAGVNEEDTYKNIKNAILDMQFILRQNNWKIKLAPETMGKINVFGSVEQVAKLADETGCEFCIDFAHILARDKKLDFEKIFKLFGKHKKWHCHFSGIVYSEKGEKHHRLTEKKEWKELLGELRKFGGEKEIVIINESPDPVGDAVKGAEVWKRM